ncbi:uncharacterized protein LOC131626941 [Vicia villosa]|uniref:uncharacterized protein LOC131612243 n=1 Tax=Vicia villosa TaxID=3911 RepID=UPI00273C134F|nr:uncharacterized protein LOC131612243 [Vicia villosa]XP_058753760.1 uncharacterized protein LOC131626941 [Vicia villosa]
MAASMSSFLPMKPRGTYLKRFNIRRGMQVIKVQNYHQDEGRSTDMVDANLIVLKERIEMVKVKERLERCCKSQHGWNYVPLSINDHRKNKRDKELRSLIELIGLVCGTIGFTSFVGTLFLCLVSLLVHLQV